MPADVVSGAEGWSVAGGPVGALVLHGFGGSPATVAPVAAALAGAGLSVAVPRLPGHGTHVEDLVPTRFADWSAASEYALAELAGSCRRVAVVGQSMGATLACRLAARHPEVVAVVAVNPLVLPADPQLVDMVRLMLDAGEMLADGGAPDLADPEATEIAYREIPLAAVLSLYEALHELEADLGRIACPVLIMTSAHDHVVDPLNSDHLAKRVAGPVERLALERSHHVATLDHDRDLVAARTVSFILRGTAAAAPEGRRSGSGDPTAG